ncbi:ATP-binding protein [Algoriphagus hitonicola]|uniref:ATP-binding protein n=1 Tax=Algoriphagus hitonicola TaxID=435880 RepID=UPI000B806CC5|nr:tetratricopeptide repeat protein [Algoriphagus hitonicola]
MLSISAQSQQPDLDSLKEVLPNASGQERVDVLNEIATQLREISSQEAMDFSLEAEKLSQELNYTYGLSKSKENIGWIYYRGGQWQLAFDFSEDAYELASEIPDSNLAARILNNMGALYYAQQNYQMAINQFKMAFELVEGSDDLYTQIRSLNNVAFNFIQVEEYDSAVFYAKKAININESSGSPYLTSFSNRVLGDVHVGRGQFDSAVVIFEKSLQMARVQGITSFQASVMHRLGNAYLQLGELEKAEKILEEGIEVSEANNYRDELSKSHKYLSQVHQRRGDIDLAYQHLNQYTIINDSLVDQANRDRIALMQGMFQENLEKSELELLKAQNKNQADNLLFINRIVWLVSIAAIIVLILGLRLYKLNRNVKKYNQDLILQKQKIADQNSDLEQKSLQLEKINETKNKLFSILGHDLRGPIGSVKSLIDLTLGGAISQQEFMSILKTLKKDVDSVHFTLTNTLKWSLAQMEGFRVNPTSVSMNEVVQGIIQLLAPQIQTKSLHISNEMPADVILYLDRDLIEVVVRNILSNAVKFSPESGEIRIVFETGENDLLWCVSDQGKGMYPEEIEQILESDYSITRSKPGTQQEKGSGLGLQVCKEFVRMSKGNLGIESEPGKGTKVCVSLPAHILRNHSETVSS